MKRAFLAILTIALLMASLSGSMVNAVDPSTDDVYKLVNEEYYRMNSFETGDPSPSYATDAIFWSGGISTSVKNIGTSSVGVDCNSGSHREFRTYLSANDAGIDLTQAQYVQFWVNNTQFGEDVCFSHVCLFGYDSSNALYQYILDYTVDGISLIDMNDTVSAPEINNGIIIEDGFIGYVRVPLKNTFKDSTNAYVGLTKLSKVTQLGIVVQNIGTPNANSKIFFDDIGYIIDPQYGFGKYSNVKIKDKFGKWPSVRTPYYSSTVGTWFTPYWFSEGEDPQSGLWQVFSGDDYTVTPNEFGFYSSGDPDYLNTTFSYLKNIGVTFALIDDTNGHFDSFAGALPAHEDKMFQVANKLGNKSVQLAFATGGIYLANDDYDHVQGDLNAYYTNYYSQYPNVYYKVNNKPFTVFFYDPTTDFTDSRFTVRYAAGICSEQYWGYWLKGRSSLGLWGWVYDMTLPAAEVMGVQPGYNRDHDQNSEYTVQRNNGANYINLWLRAVKNNPQFISLASWNDHGEETSVEAASWPTGEDDFLYQKITEGYLALKYGFIDGFLYKTENTSNVYKYNAQTNQLVIQNSVPAAWKEPVIVVPSGYFTWSGSTVVNTPNNTIYTAEDETYYNLNGFESSDPNPSFATDALNWSGGTVTNVKDTGVASLSVNCNTSGDRGMKVNLANSSASVDLTHSNCLQFWVANNSFHEDVNLKDIKLYGLDSNNNSYQYTLDEKYAGASLIDTKGAGTSVGSNSGIRIPDGFIGYVRIPLNNTFRDTGGNYIQSAGLAAVKQFGLVVENTATPLSNSKIYFDNFGHIKKAKTFGNLIVSNQNVITNIAPGTTIQSVYNEIYNSISYHHINGFEPYDPNPSFLADAVNWSGGIASGIKNNGLYSLARDMDQPSSIWRQASVNFIKNSKGTDLLEADYLQFWVNTVEMGTDVFLDLTAISLQGTDRYGNTNVYTLDCGASGISCINMSGNSVYYVNDSGNGIVPAPAGGGFVGYIRIPLNNTFKNSSGAYVSKSEFRAINNFSAYCLPWGTPAAGSKIYFDDFAFVKNVSIVFKDANDNILTNYSSVIGTGTKIDITENGVTTQYTVQ